MNRPVYFFGMTSIQLVVAFMSIIIGFVALGLFGFLVIPVIVILTKRIRKQNMGGHPNYFQSLWIGFTGKQAYTDPNNTIRQLLDKE